MNHAECVREAIEAADLSWHGDNRDFVVGTLLPLLDVRPATKRVIRWAYGYDGSIGSFEKESNGSSCVKDRFFDSRAKDPFGVGHDMIHCLHHLKMADPSGHHWGWHESNVWYDQAMEDFGYEHLDDIRHFGLDIGSGFHWLIAPREYRKNPGAVIARIKKAGRR